MPGPEPPKGTPEWYARRDEYYAQQMKQQDPSWSWDKHMAEQAAEAAGTYKQGAPAMWQRYGQDIQRDIYGRDRFGNPSSLTSDVGAHESAALGNLRDVATGQRSYALEEASRRAGATDSAIQSRALGAQRGGYNPALERQAAWARATAETDIKRQGKLAADLERQRAARAYMGASTGALGRRQGAQKVGMGYAGMGMDEKYRQAMAREQRLDYDIRGAAAGRAADRDELERKKALWQAGGQAAMGVLGSLAGGAK